MGVLNLTAIKLACDLKREAVAVPEWNGDVLVQELSASQREEVFAQVHGKTDIERGRLFRRAILARSVVDEAGAAMFDDSTIDLLMAKSATVVDRLADVALKLSGLGQTAEGDAKNA